MERMDVNSNSVSISQIKVSFGEELRRTTFKGTSFHDLEAEVRNLFKLKEGSKVVIKYQDDEGDLITLSSDSELAFAINLFLNKVLRLHVIVTEQRSFVNTPLTTTLPYSQPSFGHFREGWNDRKRIREFRNYGTGEPNNSNLGKMAARFVKHVNYDDDCSLEPNTKFMKTWQFRNDGKVPWPENCSLLFVGKKRGDQMGGPDSLQANHQKVMPGETIDVSVPLQAPSQPGKYIGYWRLSEPSGKKFGQRVRVQIQVAGTISGEQVKWSTLLNELDAMGFTDKGVNVKLLNQFNGDLDTVVLQLVKSQQKKME